MKLATVMLALAMLATAGFGAFAAGRVKHHEHHSGRTLASGKLATDGTHAIHRDGTHTVLAEVKQGKIAAIHVRDATKGDVAVKKYKTHKKMALIDVPPDDAQPAADDVDPGAEWIGYAYVDDDGTEQYYWFPAEEILDGDAGAVDYAPLG